MKDWKECPFCRTKLAPATALDHCCPALIVAACAAGAREPRIGVRALLITDEAKARAKEIIAFANAHPYRLAKGDTCLRDESGKVVLPGDMNEHRMIVPVGILAVYSLSISEPDGGLTFRHLTMSLTDAPGKVLAPEIAFNIAHLYFEFAGNPSSWAIAPPAEAPPHPVSIVQPINPIVNA